MSIVVAILSLIISAVAIGINFGLFDRQLNWLENKGWLRWL